MRVGISDRVFPVDEIGTGSLGLAPAAVYEAEGDETDQDERE